MRLSTPLLLTLTFVCAALALAEGHQRHHQPRMAIRPRSAAALAHHRVGLERAEPQQQQHKANIPVKSNSPLFTHLHQSAPVEPAYEGGSEGNSTDEDKPESSKGENGSQSSSTSSSSSEAESESSANAAPEQNMANVAARPGTGGMFTQSHVRPAVRRQAHAGLSNHRVRPGGSEFTQAHEASSGAHGKEEDEGGCEEEEEEGHHDHEAGKKHASKHSDAADAEAATTHAKQAFAAADAQARDTAMGYGYQTHDARACTPGRDPKCSWGKRVTDRVKDSSLPLTAAGFAVTHGKVNHKDPHADSMLRGRGMGRW